VLLRTSEGYSWAEDKEHCEEYGRMLNADPSKVSMLAELLGFNYICCFRLAGYLYNHNYCDATVPASSGRYAAACLKCIMQ
jgi:hypothetical protein